MSYLLTEIALEMLGYKFYDVNGTLGPMDFQQTSTCPNSDNAAVAPDSLPTILGLISNELENEPNTNGTCEFNCVVEESHRGDAARAGQTEALKANGTLTPPAALFTKLLEAEYKKVRSQAEQLVLRDKAAYLKTCPELVKQIEQRASGGGAGGISSEKLLQPFIAKEKLKLREEAKVLLVYRRLVEERLQKRTTTD